MIRSKSDKAHLENLIEANTGRLRKLEVQAAQLGPLHTPPHLLTEIEMARVEIERLETELVILDQCQPAARIHRITYKVEAADLARIEVTYTDNPHLTIEERVALPWSLSFEAESGQSLYLMACRDEGDVREIYCAITDEGETVQVYEDYGYSGVAVCSGPAGERPGVL